MKCTLHIAFIFLYSYTYTYTHMHKNILESKVCIIIPIKTMFMVKIRKSVLVVKEKARPYKHGIWEDTEFTSSYF